MKPQKRPPAPPGRPQTDPHGVICVATTSVSNPISPHELPFSAGEQLWIYMPEKEGGEGSEVEEKVESMDGWVVGRRVESSRIGFIPANYLRRLIVVKKENVKSKKKKKIMRKIGMKEERRKVVKTVVVVPETKKKMIRALYDCVGICSSVYYRPSLFLSSSSSTSSSLFRM